MIRTLAALWGAALLSVGPALADGERCFLADDGARFVQTPSLDIHYTAKGADEVSCSSGSAGTGIAARHVTCNDWTGFAEYGADTVEFRGNLFREVACN